MPHFDFSNIKIGNQYTSKDLAKLWGYKSHHALVKGIVTQQGNDNTIILFVTKEKQSGATPYEDRIEGNVLYMMGQEKHGTDQRLMRNLSYSIDAIHLFFRAVHHTPFIYYGKCRLLSAVEKTDAPSEFEFLLIEQDGTEGAESEEAIIDLLANSNEAEMEGKKYQLVYYNSEKGFIQPYARIVQLRQAIAAQIENRKKNTEPVPTTGFLVRTNTFKCVKNHGVEDIIAVFTVLSKSGNLVIVEAPAGHCTKCGIFYIHEYTYQRILSYGQPLCTVISEKQYTSGSYKRMNAGMAQQSLLRMCGYTVSATEGLSDIERRRILDTIISNGIMTKYDVIEYLYYFINMRKNDTKDMSEAIRKWKSDLRYVEGIDAYSLKRYKVDRVYRIER